MPTTSVRSGFTFYNGGALTTTPTVPAACVTQTISGIVLAEDNIPRYNVNCQYGSGWCSPATTPTPTTNPAKITAGWIYYSPGLYCPSGWETVGVAAADQHGRATSTSGVFTESPETGGVFLADYAPNELRQILAPDETAVLCCPSAMTASMNGVCVSTVPDYQITTGCWDIAVPASFTIVSNATVTYPTTVVTGRIDSLIGPISDKYSTVSIAPSEAATLVALREIGMIMLVHRPEDFPGGAGTTTTVTGPDTTTATGTATGTGSGNGTGTGAGTTTGVRVGGVVILAIILGVFLL